MTFVVQHLPPDHKSQRDHILARHTAMAIAVATAKSGPEALAALADQTPELILLDPGLRGMDGFEVCRRMRGLPDGEELFILALTGFGQDSDRDATRRGGFDGHLTRPIDVHDVYTRCARRQTSRGELS